MDSVDTGAVDVAVLVVTHGSAALLPQFVASMAAAATERSLRLVIVDSGSLDDTVATACAVAARADVLALDANRGYAAGINAGIEHVRATGGAAAYLLVNPDTRPEPGAVDQLMAALDLPGVGIACPTLRDQEGHRQDSLRRVPTVASTWCEALVGGPVADRLGLPAEVVTDDQSYAVAGPAAWATGGFLVVSEQCSRRVGSWAEDLFLYEEEVDYCLRAKEAGWVTWFVPEATAVRSVGQTDEAPWREALIRRNRVRRMAAANPWSGAAVAAGLVVGDGVRSLLGRPAARAGLWAVVHRASAAQVMARYLPTAAPPVVTPRSGTTATLVQSAWKESA
ncbi:glycosyltransferase [Pedococcus bigeumensis]|uniref:Glycosyltransferase family 2 protein n=1 Tax=Pedococcus bigeumensis TaxID=433644 RepID=A0A502CQ69_9MICO|nr:glycosyltransferase family 2 protein [Pedococcus bigeumensis]TPG13841.1 glycosyltransferase family 2 protein [Pedococcus bigeumensis]